MMRSLYFTIKNNILGGAFEATEDLFEKEKTKLILHLLFIFLAIFLVDIINVIYAGAWYVLIARIIGIALFVCAIIALKEHKHYKKPAIILCFTLATLNTLGLILAEGNLTFSNLGFSLLNIALVFLMLDKLLKILFAFFYALFITYGMAVFFALVKPLYIGIDFTASQNFLSGNVILALIPFFILLYTISAFIRYENRVKNKLLKQIDFIVGQEDKIHIANESLNEGISLASKIHAAFLPKIDRYQNNYFQENFTLLKAKNNLSGDFYWASEVDNSLYLAVVDSSENNVIGAIVGSVYFDALDSAVEKKKLRSPNDIMCFVNATTEEATDIRHLKESIHISVLRLDKEHQKIHFASEKSSLYFADHGKKVIDEYKARRVMDEQNCIKYNETILDYAQGDTIYMGSDGFANQFSGFENVKFKESVFKSFLESIKKQPLADQKKLMEEKLKMWTNGKLQTDDVCMVGLKL